jgi:hypothetical protein
MNYFRQYYYCADAIAIAGKSLWYLCWAELAHGQVFVGKIWVFPCHFSSHHCSILIYNYLFTEVVQQGSIPTHFSNRRIHACAAQRRFGQRRTAYTTVVP